MCTHCIRIMEGSLVGPKGSLSFQPWKMRNRLGNLIQRMGGVAITCIVGICFPTVENKLLKLENSSWILAVSHSKTSKQTNLRSKIYTFQSPSGYVCKGKLRRCTPSSLQQGWCYWRRRSAVGSVIMGLLKGCLSLHWTVVFSESAWNSQPLHVLNLWH